MNTKKLIGTLGLAALCAVIGCESDTDGGKAADVDFTDDVFVGDDSSIGTINIELNETSIPVAETSGFFVRVRDASGNPVPNVQVSCDTEQGLSLLEPASGFELTNDSGGMSGRVGCTVPGSLTLVCRLPVGGNRRDFAHIVCTGDVPEGFTGFPGSGGGTLGGGISSTTDGQVSITKIVYLDDGTGGGAETNVSIDTTQNTCVDDEGVAEVEPFFDTYAQVTVENNTTRPIKFTGLRYSIDNSDGNGKQFNSKQLGQLAEAAGAVNGQGGTATFTVPIFNASNGGKRYLDGSNAPADLGVRSVTFRLDGEDTSGQSFTVTGRAAASFGRYNNCPAGTTPR